MQKTKVYKTKYIYDIMIQVRSGNILDLVTFWSGRNRGENGESELVEGFLVSLVVYSAGILGSNTHLCAYVQLLQNVTALFENISGNFGPTLIRK